VLAVKSYQVFMEPMPDDAAVGVAIVDACREFDAAARRA
jgi:hypothetical protein